LVALLAALPLSSLWEAVSASTRPFFRKSFAVLCYLTLVWIAFQNFSVYFGDQAANADAFEQFDSRKPSPDKNAPNTEAPTIFTFPLTTIKPIP